MLLNAVYKNGVLVLDERLEGDQEGKRFRIILFEQESTEARKSRFFEFVEKHAFKLAPDYKFNRDELYER